MQFSKSEKSNLCLRRTQSDGWRPLSLSHFRNSGDINPKHIISITESVLLDAFRKARAASKIVAASLAARGAFKIVACFLYKVIQKFVCRNIFASADFPCRKD